MKFALISTFPPRKCGIATFSKNLIEAIKLHQSPEDNCYVVAINDQENNYDYGGEVDFCVQQNELADYIKAANHINYSGATVCLLQHEYGIFGGESGVYLLTLINRLKIPLVVTLHTILDKPSFIQLSIIQSLCSKAQAVVAMSQKGVQFLKEVFQESRNIHQIEHGVPDIIMESRVSAKDTFNLTDRKILLTFGLLSRNKGLETVIEALPKVIERHPEVLYIILGKTHPGVIKFEGESYRNKLRLLVKKLGVENHVHFFNEYLDEIELFKYLAAADIYITPYISKEQITSGTLSYALGAGCCIISTPYWHAEELLAEGRGITFLRNDHNRLATLITDLFENEQKTSEIRESALAYSEHLKWPKIGRKYFDLMEESSKTRVIKQPPASIIDLSILPPFSLSHLKLLTDDTGMIQHAKYNIPNYQTGYCTDDNARALLAMTMAYHQGKQQEVLGLITRYLSFTYYMQQENGTFRNLLSYDRKFLDETGTEDSFGRAVWSLGYLVKYAPNAWLQALAQSMFCKAEPHFGQLQSVRGLANTMIGLCYYLRKHSYDERLMTLLVSLKEKLLESYKNCSSKEWRWFENNVTYDNGILPLALYHYYEIINDEEVLQVANATTEWLDNLVFEHSYLTLVGNQGWYAKEGNKPIFDQQAIDAMAMIFLYYRAFNITKKEKYLQRLFKSFLWFLGDNALGIPVYDHKSAGCYDGLEEKGINENQGAESTLAYFLSYFRVLKAKQFEHELNMLKGEEVPGAEKVAANI